MDILKLKSEIEKFQSFAADGEETTLGPGGEEQSEETTLTIGENVSSSNSKNSWKKELQDVKTSVPLSIGLALTAGVIYDGVKNRGDEEQSEETTLTIGENVSSSNSKNSWKKELQDVKTSVPLSIGLALTAGVIYDGVKNRGDEGEVIFTDPWKTMAVFVGAGALGWGAGRITRGDLAIKNAETLKVMLAEREQEMESEKEEIEADRS